MSKRVMHSGSGKVSTWDTSHRISFYASFFYFCNPLFIASALLGIIPDGHVSVFIRNNVLLSLDQSNETVLLQFLFQSCFFFFF